MNTVFSDGKIRQISLRQKIWKISHRQILNFRRISSFTSKLLADHKSRILSRYTHLFLLFCATAKRHHKSRRRSLFLYSLRDLRPHSIDMGASSYDYSFGISKLIYYYKKDIYCFMHSEGSPLQNIQPIRSFIDYRASRYALLHITDDMIHLPLFYCIFPR